MAGDLPDNDVFRTKAAATADNAIFLNAVQD